MAISEDQLETWSHQGSVQQSAATYQTIKTVLESAQAPYANRSFNIFLQGSYGNNTNVWAESDVDIAICLTSVFYSDIDELSTDEKQRYEQNRIPAEYSINQFKDEVTSWLRQNFGSGVTPGNKAIAVPGSNSRRDADVLACAEHRRYFSYPAMGGPKFHEGICFWTSDGDKIINYPHQHMSNCTSMHQATSNRFKPNVRVLKNMRRSMVSDGYIDDGVAPSYFLEGMLYNVPNEHFVATHQQTIENALYWLERCNVPDLLCANERYYLVRDGSDVCWNGSDFRNTLTSMRRYWNSAGR
ncbi:nucleotidyltransferase [Roseobacter cerasinus]|uniref:Nucleotidyltransferase n=1 Tax=Roseobacter cerasinus TaxID=2602289 RepID=A0A640VQ18_9RHOB|nr:nucleotidyltransferase [Roseobacter cerasinus]GFE48296.1 nucleotidyltransferase [Roseobacter cerasinus]